MGNSATLKSNSEVSHEIDAVEISQLRRSIHQSDKINDEHLRRSALVYVRQSSQHQVLEHRESTATEVQIGICASRGFGLFSGV